MFYRQNGGFLERQAAYYLKAWTAVASRTAGAPGGGACFWPARPGKGEGGAPVQLVFYNDKASTRIVPFLVHIVSVSEIITVPLLLKDSFWIGTE